MAHITGNKDVWEEMHFHLDQTISLARFAAPTLDVERESSRTIASFPRLRQTREEFANRCKQTGIGGRIGARSAPDGALIHIDDFIKMFQSENRVVGRRVLRTTVKMTGYGGM
jgi:hypothetical protein